MRPCLLDHANEVPCAKYENGTPQVRRSGIKYVAMVANQLILYCGAHLVELYCKESNNSDTNWLTCLFSLYLIKIWLFFNDVMTWLIYIF